MQEIKYLVLKNRNQMATYMIEANFELQIEFIENEVDLLRIGWQIMISLVPVIIDPNK